MKNIFPFLSVILASNITLAQELPICKTGLLPNEFHGTYKTPSSNTLITLGSDKLYFQGIHGAYMLISSCLQQQKRIITLTDNEPSSTQNLAVSRLRNGNLLVEDLETREIQTWFFRSRY